MNNVHYFGWCAHRPLLFSVSASNYVLKVNNRNNWKKCEICPKIALALIIPERRHWRPPSGDFIVNLKNISYLFLTFLSIALNRYLFYVLCIRDTRIYKAFPMPYFKVLIILQVKRFSFYRCPIYCCTRRRTRVGIQTKNKNYWEKENIELHLEWDIVHLTKHYSEYWTHNGEHPGMQ